MKQWLKKWLKRSLIKKKNLKIWRRSTRDLKIFWQFKKAILKIWRLTIKSYMRKLQKKKPSLVKLKYKELKMKTFFLILKKKTRSIEIKCKDRLRISRNCLNS
jgi:hypothetical protein